MTDAIRLEAVSKRYADGTTAVDALSLEVARGELCVLVGPSGCGKTTTMKMVNRLVEPTSGRVLLDGEDVATLDPVQLRRRVGYVIQQVGLFPHQSVRDNVATVPRLLGWDRRRTRARVDELLELVGLDPDVHGRRYPSQLSGGQRQRVGVARALAADPLVLLMDEPFSAIDPVARGRLQTEFRALQQELGTTVVLVTHDVDEAVLLGDRIAVLRDGGRLEQHAAPTVVLGQPATPFVAAFVGEDRAVKRLSVTPLDLTGLAADAGPAGAHVAESADLGQALAALLASTDGRVEVRAADGSRRGVLTADALLAQARTPGSFATPPSSSATGGAPWTSPAPSSA